MKVVTQYDSVSINRTRYFSDHLSLALAFAAIPKSDRESTQHTSNFDTIDSRNASP